MKLIKFQGKEKKQGTLIPSKSIFHYWIMMKNLLIVSQNQEKFLTKQKKKNIGEENAIVIVTDTEYDINGDWIYKIVKKTILTKDGKTKEFLNIKYYSDGREEVLKDFKLKA